MKHRLLTFAKIIFATGVIAWMFSTGLLDFSVFSEISTPFVILSSLCLGFFNLIAINYRWALLLKCQNFQSNFGKTFPLTLIGIFFSYLVPGGVGGDVVKGYYLTQDNPTRRMLSVTSLLLDRLFGLYGMLILAIVSGTIGIELVTASKILSTVYAGAIGVFLLLTLFFIFSFSGLHKIGLALFRKLPVFKTVGVHLVTSLHSYGGGNPLLAVKCVAISLVAQVITIGFMINIGFALDASIPVTTYFFAVPMGFVAMALPIAPAGVGVGQLAFLVLFNEFLGETSLLGQTAISTFQMTQFCWGLVGAYFYIRLKKNTEPAALSNAVLEQS